MLELAACRGVLVGTLCTVSAVGLSLLGLSLCDVCSGCSISNRLGLGLGLGSVSIGMTELAACRGVLASAIFAVAASRYNLLIFCSLLAIWVRILACTVGATRTVLAGLEAWHSWRWRKFV
jgi:hypothetical protein